MDGLAAWLAEGHPGGGLRDRERLASIMRRDVPRVTSATTVDELPRIMGDWEVAVVVGADDIVVGTVRAEAQAGPSGLAVDQLMYTAPVTVRPSITAADLARSMDESGDSHVLVTTPGGRLLGMTRREDLDG